MSGLPFFPQPKPEKQPKARKEKAKPKYKEKRPKKKKNPYLHRGRIIPSRKERTKITKEEYNRMIEMFGNYCQECGHVPVSAHHLTFRSHFGSGNFRNLAPLCERCHTRAHKEYEFAEYLRAKRAAIYGKWYWADKYTLFKEKLIPTPTSEAYERFMLKQEGEVNE